MKMALDNNFRVGFFCPYFCRMSGTMDELVAKIWEAELIRFLSGLMEARCPVTALKFSPWEEQKVKTNLLPDG